MVSNIHIKCPKKVTTKTKKHDIIDSVQLLLLLEVNIMLKCKLNGKVIFCKDYIGYDDDNAVEKILELKSYSKEGRLTCCDEDCSNPVVFCHGEQKGSYFRHQKGYVEQCQYNKYSAERQGFDKLKILLSKQFSEQGLRVDVDAKLLPNHWTDVAVTFPSGKTVAIELTDRRFGGTDCISYHSLYEKMGIADVWIIQTEPSKQERLRDMYVTDMMQYRGRNQKQAIYFDTESERFTVRTDTEMEVRFPHLLSSRFIEITMSISDILIDEQGNLIGKYADNYREKYDKLVSEYSISEKVHIAKIKADEERRKLQEEQRRKNEERQKELYQQHLNKMKAKREQERQAAINKAQEEAKKKEDEKRKRDLTFETETIPKIREMLREKGVEIDDAKFNRFLTNNNNWLRNSFVMGCDNFILLAKYNGS